MRRTQGPYTTQPVRVCVLELICVSSPGPFRYATLSLLVRLCEERSWVAREGMPPPNAGPRAAAANAFRAGQLEAADAYLNASREMLREAGKATTKADAKKAAAAAA